MALAQHFLARAQGRRSFYTAPTKALVNEKFFELCEAFGAESVGLLTGDASVNRDASLVCCTAEILSNLALRSDKAGVDYVVMDEFHYFGDQDRGVAWQIPLVTQKQVQFLLMSATLGDTHEIRQNLQDYTSRSVACVTGMERPVPLEFEYRDTPIHETIQDLVASDRAPIYLVNFTQRDCAEQAQNLTSINVCSKEDKQAISRNLSEVSLDTPYGKEFARFLRHGIGVHHAGLLPKYRRVVERLAQEGLIRVISGTDTLGVGVNIPIRTVVIRQLYKYDGHKTALLTARDFHQITGRAGRKGFDDQGYVVVQAPEWTIENKRIDAKLQAQPHLRKKLHKKKPPPGAVRWDEAVFRSLQSKPPEALTPQFRVTHGILIQLLQAEAEARQTQNNTQARSLGYRRLTELIGRSYCTPAQKKHWRIHAANLFRALRKAGIILISPSETSGRALVSVADGLQKDFSLLHSLSLYVVESQQALDQQSDTYALDLLSLVEAIMEDPKVILFAQLRKKKDILVAQLKAQGVEYEERMERLEQVEIDKPNAEFIYTTFNAFAEYHPWLGEENIRPKSIARDMYERCLSFVETIREFGLARSEGVLLRYLSQVYKTAVQTVPENCWCESFEDVLAFLHGLIRRTDSSLLEEWELLVSDPGDKPPEAREEEEKPYDPLADLRTFKLRIRNELHVLLKALADQDYDSASGLVYQGHDHTWSVNELEQAMQDYFSQHESVILTPQARQTHNTIVNKEGPRRFDVRQKIIDPEGDQDWMLYCQVDLTKERDDYETKPLIELIQIGT